MLLSGSLEVLILILLFYLVLSLVIAALLYLSVVNWIPSVKKYPPLRLLILPIFCLLFSMVLLYYLLPILFG